MRKNKRKLKDIRKLYLKALIISVLMTLLLHFSTALLLAGFDMFNPTLVRSLKMENTNKFLFVFNFFSTTLLLFLEFAAVFRIQYGARRYRIGVLSLWIFVIALLHGLMVFFVSQNVFDIDGFTSTRMIGVLVGMAFLSLVVILIGYTDFLTKKQEIIALENESLQTQNIQSRYEALKNQLDPHFLFNTFSSLTSMIEIDPPRAQEFSIKMSSVLRYTLQNKDFVTLAEEIAFAGDYCSLMQLRYGENLDVRFEIKDSYNSHYVAPLSIQTLIENAVKHNEVSNRSPLTVSVHTNSDDTLTVSNAINLKRKEEKGTGLGLANLAERYMLKWQSEIHIYSNEKVFMVKIPLIPPEKE